MRSRKLILLISVLNRIAGFDWSKNRKGLFECGFGYVSFYLEEGDSPFSLVVHSFLKVLPLQINLDEQGLSARDNDLSLVQPEVVEGLIAGADYCFLFVIGSFSLDELLDVEA